MAFVTRTITGDLRQMFGDSIDVTAVRGYAETNLGTGQAMIFDLANDRQYLGSGRLTINQDGTWELTDIPDWNNTEADQNPTGVQVQVRFEYVDQVAALGAATARRTKQWSSGYLEVDHDGSIGEFVAQQYAPADWRSDFMAEAQEKLDTQIDISNIAVSDDVVEALVKNTGGTGPKTSSALSATIEDGVGTFLNVFRPEDFGGIADGTTDNSAAIMAAHAAAVAAGGGQVLFGKGTYRFSQITISDNTRIHVTWSGSGMQQTILYAAPLLNTDALVFDSGATNPNASTFLRALTIENLCIQGSTNRDSGTMAPRRGLVLGRCQNVDLRDVWISQFARGGLILDDCYDSTFTRVQVLWCGEGPASGTSYWAVRLTGTIDNSNANKFISCHFEINQLMLRIDTISRQNWFVNCKFEHGSQTAQNASANSPFYFAGCLENGFTNCLFTEDVTSIGPSYFIASDSFSTGSVNQFRKAVTFEACQFMANSVSKARWATGYDLHFHDCEFENTDGSTPLYAFDFQARCTLVDSRVTFTDAGSGLARIVGAGNRIENTTVYTANSGTANALYTIGSAATFSKIKDNFVVGALSSSVATTLDDLGNNICSSVYNVLRTVSGGGAPSIFLNTNVVCSDSSAATYTNFKHGCAGHQITVTATNGGVVTLQHNATMQLASGIDKTLAAGESVELVNRSGVWRQIAPPRPLPRFALAAGSYVFPNAAAGQSTGTIGTGVLRLTPFYVGSHTSITRIGAEVTTIGDAGSKVRLGIYADSGGGLPGALVIDAGQIAGDSATVQDITLGSTLVLPPGWYWVGAAVQSVTTTQPTLRTVGNANISYGNGFLLSLGTSVPSAGASTCGYQQSSVTGALPSTFVNGGNIGSAPRIHFKLA